MTELERLRADLKVIERYEERMYALAAAKAEIGNKIRKLEAEADPWREAKTMIEGWRKDILSGRHISPAGENAVHLFDHLTAENARLEKRVAELEAEDATDVADAEAALAKGEFVPFEDMQPPFEGPIVGIEPVLDPARVLATAVELGWGPTVYAEMTLLRDAKPYRLKGTDE